MIGRRRRARLVLASLSPNPRFAISRLIEDIVPLDVAAVGTIELAGAIRLLRKFSDQGITLADAVGLHLMRTQRVRKCWSTDFHLGLIGVPLVINEN